MEKNESLIGMDVAWIKRVHMHIITFRYYYDSSRGVTERFTLTRVLHYNLVGEKSISNFAIFNVVRLERAILPAPTVRCLDERRRRPVGK